jgi:retron-type reverse transcriptase
MSELLEKILSRENMNEAYKRVKANKGAGGVDNMEIDELPEYIRENWDSIKEQIRERKYKPQPVRRVEIPKPNGGKRRGYIDRKPPPCAATYGNTDDTHPGRSRKAGIRMLFVG